MSPGGLNSVAGGGEAGLEGLVLGGLEDFGPDGLWVGLWEAGVGLESVLEPLPLPANRAPATTTQPATAIDLARGSISAPEPVGQGPGWLRWYLLSTLCTCRTGIGLRRVTGRQTSRGRAYDGPE